MTSTTRLHINYFLNNLLFSKCIIPSNRKNKCVCKVSRFLLSSLALLLLPSHW